MHVTPQGHRQFDSQNNELRVQRRPVCLSGEDNMIIERGAEMQDSLAPLSQSAGGTGMCIFPRIPFTTVKIILLETASLLKVPFILRDIFTADSMEHNQPHLGQNEREPEEQARLREHLGKRGS